MSKMLISAAIVAAAVAPQTVLAAEASDALGTSGATSRFEIVDAQSGRVLGVLVPVADSPGTLRLIGAVRTPAVAPPRSTNGAPQLLTPNQMSEQRQREIETQFHIDHTP